MTKMTATVHVEFELLEGQANNTANTALIGGVGSLKLAIERGVTGTGQTGVKPGTGRSPDWIKVAATAPSIGSGKYCGSEDHLIKNPDVQKLRDLTHICTHSS